MRKFVAILMCLCLFTAMTMSSYASNDNVTCPIIILSGIRAVDDEDDLNRAINPPTSFAPSSYYDTYHYWSAVNYTWSAYKFTETEGLFFYATARQSFNVKLYYANGTTIGTWSAELQSDGSYLFNSVMNGAGGYYFKLINTSGTPISRSQDVYYSVNGSGS